MADSYFLVQSKTETVMSSFLNAWLDEEPTKTKAMIWTMKDFARHLASDISLLRKNTDLRKQLTKAGQLWKVKKCGESTNPIYLMKNAQT